MDTSKLIRTESYVNGQWVRAASRKTFDVINPATGEVLAAVTDMGREDTRKAIEAANSAWPAYRDLTAKERSALLRKWFNLILENRDELAKLMTLECGKVLNESLGEVTYGAGFVEWFAEEAKRTYGDVIPANSNDRRIVVIKQSIGVAAAITPWNFPLAMITRKVGPALAAGSPVVVKPPTETPLTALAISHLAELAGFPPGVYNTVTTSDNSEVGKELCENKKVRKLSFTGSTAVGRVLMSQSASTLKKLSLELGGNAAFIVFDDADIDEAVKGAMASKFRNSGQTCVCVNRLMVQDGVYDEFVEKFSKAVAALKVGNGLEEGAEIGPLINEKGLAKVKNHMDDALAKGGKVVVGGKAMEGLYFEPTVLADATQEMIISREEVFGPVAPVFRFKTEEEAIRIANDTDFGLASYFYSRDVGRCWRVAEALETGMVGINEGMISTEVAPFGGVKQSGIGREGSKYGMDYFMEIKYLCFGGLK
ncbi:MULTISPECIES: NAD-dependent succinate-semialdehyde dehydrogenase [unclassified Imperialibacter]|uniref:NAD-dependent succinate-semialdehyde dehydrogenase n=1 Tax=unclassified Imperialibacter TaxID=2629706 RepID=UPI00125553FE|nr:MULTISPECIES: NAD-dependent succinate-semialdehyde dehydrogenase [unclassified Imperialibacter]CAD5255104.1 succinate-semialdehyde dehydrogenase I, NADP-dependent [Imperialibacter sp. 75]CAD5263649.1 succinate-semialdehyde dehydrogenase I, NADP-dependent [Imperialibacter sp. 89]VVT35489.1 succinate-semialdehyde dehydrogenase I, NADP-dependent [Imperialibacter sp. EC-SDR9]